MSTATPRGAAVACLSGPLERRASARGLRFLGTGVSGGEEGALNGPSIMPGGSPEAYGLVEQQLTTIAAQVGLAAWEGSYPK